jgi:hypothetical protein
MHWNIAKVKSRHIFLPHDPKPGVTGQIVFSSVLSLLAQPDSSSNKNDRSMSEIAARGDGFDGPP